MNRKNFLWPLTLDRYRATVPALPGHLLCAPAPSFQFFIYYIDCITMLFQISCSIRPGCNTVNRQQGGPRRQGFSRGGAPLMPGYILLICGKVILEMYDLLEWDDVFQVWFDPNDPVTEVNLSDEDRAAIAEQGFDRWLMGLAGAL